MAEPGRTTSPRRSSLKIHTVVRVLGVAVVVLAAVGLLTAGLSANSRPPGAERIAQGAGRRRHIGRPRTSEVDPQHSGSAVTSGPQQGRVQPLLPAHLKATSGGSREGAPDGATGAARTEDTAAPLAGDSSQDGSASGSERPGSSGGADSAWKTNGTLVLVRLVSRVGRAVVVVACAGAGGDAVALEAAKSLPLQFTVSRPRGCGPSIVADPGGRAGDDSGAVAWARARAPRAAAMAAEIPGLVWEAGDFVDNDPARARGELLRSVRSTDSGDDLEDADVVVVDASTVDDASLRSTLVDAVRHAMLHTLVVGLSCTSRQQWGAVEAAASAEPEWEPWLGVNDGSQTTRVDFFCHDTSAISDAGSVRLVGAHRLARAGAALLSRIPVWPSVQHGWRLLQWPWLAAAAPIAGLPRTLHGGKLDDGGDVLVADVRAGADDGENRRLVYKVPTACVPRLGTPFQLVEVTRDARLYASYAISSLPLDVTTMMAGEVPSVPMSDVERALDVDWVSWQPSSRNDTAWQELLRRAPGAQRSWWSDAKDDGGAFELAYAGRYCGISTLALLFTVDRPLFQTIALPLVETLWEEARVPTIFLPHRWPSLPGVHVSTYHSWQPARRFIAWQMEYERSRMISEEMLQYLAKAEAVWEYAEVNLGVLAEAHNLTDVPLVPPCYHPAIEIHVPVPPTVEFDVVFLGTFGTPRRQRMWRYILDSGAEVNVGELLIGGAMVREAMRGDVSLNIHAFEDAVLELTRLVPLLANGMFVLTEEGRDAGANSLVRSGTAMVPALREAVRDGLADWIGGEKAQDRAEIAAEGQRIARTQLHCRRGVAKVLQDLRDRSVFPEWLPWWEHDRPPLDEAGA